MKFDELIDLYRKDIIENVKNLVRIPSVEEKPKDGMPFGEGPYKALEYTLNLGKKLGFIAKNFDGYAGHIEYGNGEEIVGVLAHVDVVPVGSDWSMDPFCGDEINGKIYGRGSYDDKGACIVSIYALKALKESGVDINKKIRLIFGANEETGMNDIPYYLTKEKEPDMAFSPDAPFPVIYGEKGIINLKLKKECNQLKYIKNITGGTSLKFVPDECCVHLQVNDKQEEFIIRKVENIHDSAYKYDCCTDVESGDFKITVYGKTASGTKPGEGINAISGMIKLLSKMEFIDEDIKEITKLYNEKISTETDGKSVECDFEDGISTPLTLNVGTISMENKSLEIGIHIRYPVTSDFEKIKANLIKNLSTDQICLEIESHSPSHYVPKDSKLIKTLMSIYEEVTGDSESKPTTMEGGTYSRTLKNAVAFGPLFPGEKQVAHGPDEYVNIDSLIKACKIYAGALYELSK